MSTLKRNKRVSYAVFTDKTDHKPHVTRTNRRIDRAFKLQKIHKKSE